MTWLQRISCAFGIHRWVSHSAVGDWFCDRCRIRKPDIGVRK